MSINNANLPKRCYETHIFGWGQPLARPSRDNFAENFNRILVYNKIRNATVARELGVSRMTVGRWRDGEAQPGYEDLDKLASFLGIPVSALFEDPTDPKSTDLPLDKALRMVTEAIRNMQKS
jgi:transcriptional regulator with XRE-family HTH domain